MTMQHKPRSDVNLLPLLKPIVNAAFVEPKVGEQLGLVAEANYMDQSRG